MTTPTPTIWCGFPSCASASRTTTSPARGLRRSAIAHRSPPGQRQQAAACRTDRRTLPPPQHRTRRDDPRSASASGRPHDAGAWNPPRHRPPPTHGAMRLVALAEVLGSLRAGCPRRPVPSRAISQARVRPRRPRKTWHGSRKRRTCEAHSRRPWIPYTPEVTVTRSSAVRRDVARWRDSCLYRPPAPRRVGPGPGDHAMAWAVLLHGHGQEQAVQSRLSMLLADRSHGTVHFLGVGRFARAYPDNERVAAAIGDADRAARRPGWLSTD